MNEVIDFDTLLRLLETRSWVSLVAVLTWGVIAAAKRYATNDRLPPQWQWLRPIILAALMGFFQGLLDTETFMGGLLGLLDAAGLGGIGAMLIHGSLKSSPLPYGETKE